MNPDLPCEEKKVKYMFKDYKVVITGVSEMPGYLIAEAFLNRGAHVIGIDQAESVVHDSAGRFLFIRDDFKDQESTEGVCRAIANRFGNSLDILVNSPCAHKDIDLRTVDLKSFEDYLRITLFSVIDLNRRLYPLLLNSEHGCPSVVNIIASSTRTNISSTGLDSLCSQALIRLTRMQAGSYDGVRCNSISSMNTEIRGNCETLLNTTLFLCSEDAGYISGTDILIDGGKTTKNGAKLTQGQD